MEYVQLGNSGIQSSRLVYGCMRIAGDGTRGDLDKGRRAIRAALDAGYTQFDHADIYGAGQCEQLFGDVLRDSPSMRDRIVITTKCGVRFAGQPAQDAPARYDLSAAHIRASVEGSLRRLGVEHVDLLLLHRPDYLMRADEVARAFDELKSAGKVSNFGVSNFTPAQVEWLRSATSEALVVNQVEINVHNIRALEDGTLEQCQQLGMTSQAWCPLGGIAYPAWGNAFDAATEQRIRIEVERQCRSYGVDAAGIALAWILRHPAGIQPIVGSTTPSRIEAATRALELPYSREDWYRILEARNGRPVP